MLRDLDKETRRLVRNFPMIQTRDDGCLDHTDYSDMVRSEWT